MCGLWANLQLPFAQSNTRALESSIIFYFVKEVKVCTCKKLYWMTPSVVQLLLVTGYWVSGDNCSHLQLRWAYHLPAKVVASCILKAMSPRGHIIVQSNYYLFVLLFWFLYNATELCIKTLVSRSARKSVVSVLCHCYWLLSQRRLTGKF